MKYFTLLLCLVSFTILAQKKAYNPEESDHELYEYGTYVKVDHHDYTIDEIIKNQTLKFSPLTNDNHSEGFTCSSYWVKFSLYNSSDYPNTYFLETGRPITDVADLYQVSDSGIQKFRSGDQIPFNERQVAHRSTVFKIELPPKIQQDFYLHLKSDGETINIPLYLRDTEEFMFVESKQQLFFGVFYGLLCFAGLIYMFFYFSMKEKSFLYYGFYVFSIVFLQAALDGFVFQYIIPHGGYLNSRMVMIAAVSSNLFLLKYCEHFLKIKTELPQVQKFFNIIYGVLALVFVMIFITPKSLEYTYPIANLNGLISLIFLLGILFVMYYKGIKIDYYFSIGVFFLVIGLLGFVMNNLSLLPNNFYTLNSAKFGAGLEVVFLSLSMTNLIRMLRMENENSQNIALQKSEEISQLKSFFMSNISHELRTPINAIRGIASHLLEKGTFSQHREDYEMINNASLSLLSSVNDILDFEKIEKNKLVLRLETFNPLVLLNQISLNWKYEAEKKGLIYTFDMGVNIPLKVHGDTERFIQIINNVLSNAVKFTVSGSIDFKLRCSLLPGGQTRFSFTVTDTGVGMGEDKKNNAFDSFNQMSLNDKRRFGGIGLGLTIVKHLVVLFQGRIHIESSIGEGTSVFIDLPLQAVSVNEVDLLSVENQKPLRVLIVEDNKMNQLVLVKLLSRHKNLKYTLAENGQVAIDLLTQKVYDIILMDLQMPIMDGFEATKIIRSGILGENVSSVPIIVITADATQETHNRVLNLGINDYLIKPVSSSLLSEKINACFDTDLNIV